MTTKSSRTLPPNILVAARVQRLLSPLPLETQRTVLEFTLKCLEEQAAARYKEERDDIVKAMMARVVEPELS